MDWHIYWYGLGTSTKKLYEPVGTIDHYLSCKNHRHLSYEWSNYRFVSAWINSSKGDLDQRVLDHFLVEDEWFEILLPSLQLIITNAIPQGERKKAEFTLKRLHLQDNENIIRQREAWYQMYLDGEITLIGLEKKAPLIARAIKNQQMGIG